MYKYYTLFIFSVILLNSCTIEKRKYTSGYHTTWNVQRISAKGNSENKYDKVNYSAPKIFNEKDFAQLGNADDSLKHQKEIRNRKLQEVANLKKEKAPTSVSDTVPEKTEEFLSTLSPQNAPIAREYIEQSRKHLKARLGIFTSAIVGTIGFAIALENDAVLAYIAFGLGYLGIIVFGIMAIVILIHKITAYYDLRRSILYSNNNYNKSTNSLNALKLIELEEKIKYNNWKTLILGVISMLAGIIDIFEIGALGYLISSPPLFFFGVSLFFFLILRLRKLILKTKLKKMTT